MVLALQVARMYRDNGFALSADQVQQFVATKQATDPSFRFIEAQEVGWLDRRTVVLYRATDEVGCYLLLQRHGQVTIVGHTTTRPTEAPSQAVVSVAALSADAAIMCVGVNDPQLRQRGASVGIRFIGRREVRVPLQGQDAVLVIDSDWNGGWTIGYDALVVYDSQGLEIYRRTALAP